MTTRYMIIRDEDKGEFEYLMEKYLNNGWGLHGNLCITSRGSCVLYVQALVKLERENE